MDCSIFFAATFVSGKPFQPCPTFLNIARSPLWRRLRKALGSLQRIRLVWQGLLGIDVLTYFAAPSLMDKNSIITLIPGPTETDLLRQADQKILRHRGFWTSGSFSSCINLRLKLNAIFSNVISCLESIHCKHYSKSYTTMPMRDWPRLVY